MHVLLKRMAHSLFIIFLRVFSYFLISFILFWSFCKIKLIRKYENTRKKIINNECDILFKGIGYPKSANFSIILFYA